MLSLLRMMALANRQEDGHIQQVIIWYRAAKFTHSPLENWPEPFRCQSIAFYHFTIQLYFTLQHQSFQLYLVIHTVRNSNFCTFPGKRLMQQQVLAEQGMGRWVDGSRTQWVTWVMGHSEWPIPCSGCLVTSAAVTVAREAAFSCIGNRSLPLSAIITSERFAFVALLRTNPGSTCAGFV